MLSAKELHVVEYLQRAYSYTQRLCIAQVQATDGDVGRNAEIEYSLVGEPRARRYASIDPRTGALRLLRDLDFEQTLEQSLVLHILARDSPSVGPRLSATATLTVNVRLLLVQCSSYIPGCTPTYVEYL